MSKLLDHIANKIRELRVAAEMTQADLASKVGVTQNTLSRWENGEYKPKIDELEKLARAFQKPIRVFFPPDPDIDASNAARRALLSATGDLPPEDIEELQRYADFVRARKKLRKA